MPRRAASSAGFTLLEIMVVLLLIGLIAAFVVPKIGKVTTKAKITDAINVLGSVASQVQAVCATKEAFPTADIATFSDNPNGFTLNWGSQKDCGDFTIVATAVGTPLSLTAEAGINRSISYAASLPDGWSCDDIPLPSSKLQCGSASSTSR